MVLDNVSEYVGQHAVTFQKGPVSKNTWTDWGLIPSSRHSEPVNEIMSQEVSIAGVNGQADILRYVPQNVANNYALLRMASVNDKREKILTDLGYDIFKPTSGSLSFVIADQTKSFFEKRQEIVNFLHNQKTLMIFADDPNKIYEVRTTVSSFESGANYSTVSISYSVINEN